MNSATLKSIVLFLLNDVDVKTNENAIELFERWRKTTHFFAYFAKKKLHMV